MNTWLFGDTLKTYKTARYEGIGGAGHFGEIDPPGPRNARFFEPLGFGGFRVSQGTAHRGCRPVAENIIEVNCPGKPMNANIY